MLTKSDIQSLLQCSRKLWLEHHNPELAPKDEPTLYRRAIDGRIVGDKAREQFGADFIWPPGAENHALAADGAKILLAANPQKPAAEVPMVHRGLYARADALIPEGNRYVLRETKASTFPLKKDKVTPDVPEEHYLNDVAIQVWTMEGFGLFLARAELNLLDNQWRYPGGGDYSGLFRVLDVSADANGRKNQVEAWLHEAQTALAGNMPQVETGKQCSDPYACPFRSYCEGLDPPHPEHPIELLPDAAGKSLARKLRESKGYTSILDPKPAELTGKQADLYRRIQTAHRTGKAVLEPGSGAPLIALPYPRYYFDFEGIDLPVPRWQGVRPYEQIPFQWSCHIERSPGAFDHAEFLDLTGNDPSRPCIERMQDVISPDDGGPIFVYYQTYEKSRLAELSIRHPEFTGVVQKYIGRLFDLHPLVKQYFYHPQMRGSFSIKGVLPAIAPNLDYGELDEVQEGTAAQVAYLYAALDPNTTAERKADLEAKLRMYCRQDTWAMVEVAYFLARSGRPKRPDGM
jgi:CRISPR/Cas system-associated exonuclease Cas4 (RecB family)